MAEPADCAATRLHRRAMLTGLAASAGALLAEPALAEDQALQQLLLQTQSGELGQSFDSASRTILMPKASLPTRSPTTAQMSERAIAQYETFVARGCWPTVPATGLVRMGNRQPVVRVLRQRLVATGDLDINAGLG